MMRRLDFRREKPPTSPSPPFSRELVMPVVVVVVVDVDVVEHKNVAVCRVESAHSSGRAKNDSWADLELLPSLDRDLPEKDRISFREGGIF